MHYKINKRARKSSFPLFIFIIVFMILIARGYPVTGRICTYTKIPIIHGYLCLSRYRRCRHSAVNKFVVILPSLYYYGYMQVPRWGFGDMIDLHYYYIIIGELRTYRCRNVLPRDAGKNEIIVQKKFPRYVTGAVVVAGGGRVGAAVATWVFTNVLRTDNNLAYLMCVNSR